MRGDRQVDQPRPVDIAAAMRRVEPMLGEVVPALAAEPGADLRHAQIVVGVGQRERLDLAASGWR